MISGPLLPSHIGVQQFNKPDSSPLKRCDAIVFRRPDRVWVPVYNISSQISDLVLCYAMIFNVNQV